MEHTTRIPPTEITGLKGALIKRMIDEDARQGARRPSASSGTTPRS